MKIAFVILFVLAALVAALHYGWTRLSQPRKAQIIAAARATARRVSDMGRALAERMERRKAAYRHLFLNDRGELSPDGSVVIAHLTKFCYGFATTAANEASPDEMMRREGRRQVLIEIFSKLALSPVDALNAAQQEEVVLG